MKIIRLVLILLVTVSLGIPAFAADRKSELVEAVDYAVKLIESKGKTGLDELKPYRFAGGEGYIYVTDIEAVVIMHPVAKELLGKNCMAIKDAEGKFFGAEMLGKAKKDGIGWTSYMWPNPKNNNTPERKCSHFKVANMGGQKVVVYAALGSIEDCN